MMQSRRKAIPRRMTGIKKLNKPTLCVGKRKNELKNLLENDVPINLHVIHDPRGEQMRLTRTQSHIFEMVETCHSPKILEAEMESHQNTQKTKESHSATDVFDKKNSNVDCSKKSRKRHIEFGDLPTKKQREKENVCALPKEPLEKMHKSTQKNEKMWENHVKATNISINDFITRDVTDARESAVFQRKKGDFVLVRRSTRFANEVEDCRDENTESDSMDTHLWNTMEPFDVAVCCLLELFGTEKPRRITQTRSKREVQCANLVDSPPINIGYDPITFRLLNFNFDDSSTIRQSNCKRDGMHNTLSVANLELLTNAPSPTQSSKSNLLVDSMGRNCNNFGQSFLENRDMETLCAESGCEQLIDTTQLTQTQVNGSESSKYGINCSIHKSNGNRLVALQRQTEIDENTNEVGRLVLKLNSALQKLKDVCAESSEYHDCISSNMDQSFRSNLSCFLSLIGFSTLGKCVIFHIHYYSSSTTNEIKYINGESFCHTNCSQTLHFFVFCLSFFV